MNTKDVGNVAELETASFFRKQDWAVSFPFGDNCPYDLIVESPRGELYRLQVKKGTWKNDVIQLRLRTVSKNYCKTVNKDRVEAFVLWDGEKLYIVPTREVEEHASAFTLRKTAPKNGQKSGVSMADDYFEAVWRLGV